MAFEYVPVSDVEPQLRLALDIRDVGAITGVAAKGQPVDWGAARAIYEQGRNSRRGDGSLRTLASVAKNKGVLAQFPNGAEVLGTESFLDARVQEALGGTGSSKGQSERARHQAMDKAMLGIMYGEVLEELEAARSKVGQGNLDRAKGAPHNVDEAWAYYAGAKAEDGKRPYSLSSTAGKREANFKVAGKIDGPLQQALAAAQTAAQKGDGQTLEEAAGRARGYLNAICYLACLRYAGSLKDAPDAGTREVQLAEAWGFFQTLRPAIASASREAARAVKDVFSRPATGPFTAGDTTTVYGALNDPRVLQALAVPAPLVFRAPPA